MDHKTNKLLLTLQSFAGLYAKQISIEALTAGLPFSSDPGVSGSGSALSVENFSRAAGRAGFATNLVERELTSLSDLVLPCILLLKGEGACILEKVDRENGQAKVIHPDIEQGEIWISLDELDDLYLGYAYLLKKHYERQKRSLQLISQTDGHWFWSTIAKSKSTYTSVIIASVMINVFVLATPLYTMNVYDRVVPNDALSTLWVLAIGVAIVFVIDIVLRYLRNYMLETAGKKSDVIISSILFEQVMNLRMEAWPKSVGAFANNLREFESIRRFLASATIVALVDLPFSLLFLVAIAYIAGWVVIVPLTIILILLTYGSLLVGPLQKSVESTYEASSNKHSLLVENLFSIHTIKTMGVSNHAQWEWEEATGDIANKSLRSRMLEGSISVTTTLLVNVSTIGIMIMGVYAVRNLDLSLGGLIATVILSSRAIAPMGQLASLIANYQQMKTSYLNLDELMNRPVERPADQQFVNLPSLQGRLKFSDVSFSYPDAEEPSLSSVTLAINAGEKVGVIGKVGSGKTTLANLLSGLYAPSGGKITVDDIDIRAVDPADLRRNVAYISQDSVLFRGSLKENIAFKNPFVSDSVLFDAANLGGVDLFVNRFPKGFDTQVGEQGHSLSGGQRQSVYIARALLLGAPLIVMDEPTSSMDNTTEHVVRERLFEYTRDKTLILISHKSTMLELVDRLIVLDEGKVIMDGQKENVLKALQGG